MSVFYIGSMSMAVFSLWDYSNGDTNLAVGSLASIILLYMVTYLGRFTVIDITTNNRDK